MGSTGRLCKKECLDTVLKGISGRAESYVKWQTIPDCDVGARLVKDLLPDSEENRG